jgi:Concanavalin A-like lectin/glucanases superfamily
MLWILVGFLLLLPGLVRAAVTCDALDDDLSTSLPLSTFITNPTGSAVVVVVPTGTPTTAGSGADCYNGEWVLADGGGGPYFGIYRHPSFGGGDRFCGYNWDGSADTTAAPYTPGVRIHLALVHTGGTLALYTNGALTGTVASGDTEALTRTLRACGGVTATGSAAVPFQGRVEEVKLYDVALTASMIAAEGTSGVHNVIPTASTGRWLFDDCTIGASGAGVLFRDRTGNGRTITGDTGANATGLACNGSTMSYPWGVW